MFLDEGGVALVGCGLQLGRQRVHRDYVRRIEGPAEHHACAVLEGDHCGRDGPLVSGGQEVCQLRYEAELIVDLPTTSTRAIDRVVAAGAYHDICLDVCHDDGLTQHSVFGRIGLFDTERVLKVVASLFGQLGL